MKDVKGFRIHIDSISPIGSDDSIQNFELKNIPKLPAPSGVYRASSAAGETEYMVHSMRPDESFRQNSDNDLAGDHTGFVDISDLSEFGGHHMPSSNSQWNGFFSSPQFYVVTATLVVLVAGASMYSSLNNKIDQARLETKSDTQIIDSRRDIRFDKIDARFDKIDARFDSILGKMDADARETRELIRSSLSSK